MIRQAPLVPHPVVARLATLKMQSDEGNDGQQAVHYAREMREAQKTYGVGSEIERDVEHLTERVRGRSAGGVGEILDDYLDEAD